MTVPIATSPGRSGFGPQLSLSYDSGTGNGPFGFGWSLTLPSITRKTDKGLPRYLDAVESDVFVLSGAEDLVPILVQDASSHWVSEKLPDRTVGDKSYRIRRYRPRIEGLFARIERWTNTRDATDVFWRSISKDNVTTWYGRTPESRIADPVNPGRIFSWLICESHDDKGNVMVYGYKSEGSENVVQDSSGKSLAKAHERNRSDQSRSAQRYLKRIRYGNRRPYFPDLKPASPWPEPPGATALDARDHWFFEVVFDYGEHRPEVPASRDDGKWPTRPDPFSSYRAGFEVRTYRTCQRALMFHHFPDEAGVGADCLVRSTDLTYSDEVDPADVRNPVYTFLRSVTQTGYRRNGIGYDSRSLPPVEFEYTQSIVQDTVESVDPQSLANLPIGVDGSTYRWTDLHGEGIPGVLTEQGGAWFYKRNFSPIPDRTPEGREYVRAKFAALETVATKPNVALAGGADFMDLAGDGQPDVVVMDGPTPGLYEHDEAEGWQPFRPFTSRLHRDMRDTNVKFVDVDGDGHADVLITEDDALVWHASLAEAGFGPAQRVAKALDEEKGPRVVFADGTQSIYLADLSGDGLTDIVRVRNGEVCYWPNLGYARFGAKVTMDNAPWFDNPDQFDQKRIRLADIDGSGTTDIIYLHRDGVRLYFNQSGNGWSQAQPLKVFPRVDDVLSIVPTDLLGNGTACLVWSSPLPGDARLPMRYVNLMGGQKPHLLVKTANNLGVETRVDYAPSTKFYLLDEQGGKPWITRLPFPVHVVERVETHDHISGNRFVARYAYHHGYFDGEEREFRGFGMVEQWDTESFAALAAGGVLPEPTNIDAVSHVPAVVTRTWFHTGAYLGRDRISHHFENEYYRRPGLDPEAAATFLLDDTSLPSDLSIEEQREACRALKGSMLRQEVYAEDAGPGSTPEQVRRAHTPYAVTEKNFTLRVVQPRSANRHAVFFTHAGEAINYHYERNPSDPRVQHSLTLEVDDYGNVRKEVAVAYGRLTAPTDQAFTRHDVAKQTRPLITCTVNDFTNAIDELARYPDDYRVPLPADARTYELTGFTPERNAARFSLDEWTRKGYVAINGAHEAGYHEIEYTYEEQAGAGVHPPRKRLIEHIRTCYRADTLTGLLPFGKLEPRALPGEGYRLALTTGLWNRVYVRKNDPQPDEELLTEPERTTILGGQGAFHGGYRSMDGAWWIPSGLVYYSDDPNHTPAKERMQAEANFFLPRRYRDPFGNDTTVDYDGPIDPAAPRYDLLAVRTVDALGNTFTAANDYRVLQPKVVTDPNNNRSAVAFDALGMVAATAVMGKVGEAVGDLLDDFAPDLASTEPSMTELQVFAADPAGKGASFLRRATTRIIYDLNRFRRAGQPPFAATLVRETHFHDNGGPDSKIQVAFSYSDGFGREIQKKVQAEPGDAPGRLDAVTMPSGDTRPGQLVRDAQGKPVQAAAPNRWVGTGRTVYNNKGKPVRRYEPFFSSTHLFESEPDLTDTGVSPVLFYDPVERVVATLHPNGTFRKVVFDAWRQANFDVNDTVAPSAQGGSETGDPRTDPHIAGYVGPYFAAQPAGWQTWYAQRIGRPPGDPERVAAEKAAAHADTPTVAHLDALGRIFLTVAHNRVVCPDHARDGTEETLLTRTLLDIEGNQREVRDAVVQNGDLLGRIVMQYDYDMLGNRIHQASMEAGERWTLGDVTGKPIRAWDSRGFIRRMTYDELRRTVALFVTENGGEREAERTEYGEGQGDARNHLARVFRVYDGAGVVTSVDYDFKGNLRESRRELLPDYKQAVDWGQNPAANGGTFTSRTTFDALNRPLTVTSPDGSVYRPTFSEANLLDKVDVNLRGEMASGQPEWKHFVTNVSYNAKGQRTQIDYGNGATTAYAYDPLTFRLVQMTTKRPASSDAVTKALFTTVTGVQDLRYVYDPAGNITQIKDAALKGVFHNNEQVEPVSSYTYDAIYRLIEARGREHIGQTAFDIAPPGGDHRDYPFVGHRTHPNDLQALRNYIERFDYDPVGNIDVVHHTASGGGWTRTYVYEENSLIESEKKSNRLSRTVVGNGLDHTEAYGYTYEIAPGEVVDAHGCMTAIGSMLLTWDFEDQLQRAEFAGGSVAYCVYDASGQRVRKVIEDQQGTLLRERIYVGGFEVFREHAGANAGLVRESLHVMDDRQRIALVETRTDTTPTDTLVRYQAGNHLGSVSVELDPAGALISYEEYHPYGTTAFQAGRSAAEVNLKRYRYTGKERDEETGLSYHGARYCATWIQRWTSCEPSYDGQNATVSNRYQYCENSPLCAVDPDGRDVVVLPTSRVSARQLVKMVKAEERIPEWMRNAIALNPKDDSRIQFIPNPGPKGKLSKAELGAWNESKAQWGEIYRNAEVAARSDRFAFTTGVIKELPARGSSPPLALLAVDVESGKFGKPMASGFLPLYGSSLLPTERGQIVGITILSMNELQNLKTEERTNDEFIAVSNDLAGGRSLVVVASRVESASGEKDSMSDREIVATFLHELVVHAGGIAQEKVEFGHGSKRARELGAMLELQLPGSGGFDSEIFLKQLRSSGNAEPGSGAGVKGADRLKRREPQDGK
jgi:RHS repeat-associated protein